MRAIRVVLQTIIVTLLSGSVSCGLFDTRDPAEPEPTDQTCLPLTSPVNTRFNIVTSYGRTAKLTCYSSLLDPTFQFHPDPQDSLQNPNGFAAWDDSVEAEHSSAVGAQQTFISVSLVFKSKVVSTDQTVETHFFDYTVRARGLEGDTTVVRYTGIADITFRLSAGLWKIVDWADHRGGATDSSWSLLRVNQRPGGAP